MRYPDVINKLSILLPDATAIDAAEKPERLFYQQIGPGLTVCMQVSPERIEYRTEPGHEGGHHVLDISFLRSGPWGWCPLEKAARIFLAIVQDYYAYSILSARRDVKCLTSRLLEKDSFLHEAWQIWLAIAKIHEKRIPTSTFGLPDRTTDRNIYFCILAISMRNLARRHKLSKSYQEIETRINAAVALSE